MMFKRSSVISVSLCAFAFLGSLNAHAGLFEDEDARKAILEIRQRLDDFKAFQQRSEAEDEKTKHNMLEEANTLEGLRAEIATLRGEKDALTKELSDTQRKLKDLSQSIDQRFAKLEPVSVNIDGKDYLVDQNEKKEFEAALDNFKKGDFAATTTAFNDFLRRHPLTPYKITSLFWLGNAQYATREYKDAIANFKLLISIDAKHPRAAEAMLSISNCQLDMKDTKAAKKTWDDLIKAYPDSDAAAAAKERIARLK